MIVRHLQKFELVKVLKFQFSDSLESQVTSFLDKSQPNPSQLT